MTGLFYSQWGSGYPSSEIGHFHLPLMISYDLNEKIFFISDQHSIQLFEINNENNKNEGKCIQRMNEICRKEGIYAIYGICRIDNQLFVLDSGHERILVLNGSGENLENNNKRKWELVDWNPS